MCDVFVVCVCAHGVCVVSVSAVCVWCVCGVCGVCECCHNRDRKRKHLGSRFLLEVVGIDPMDFRKINIYI